MSKRVIFEQYKADIKNLKQCAQNLGITELETDALFAECFEQLKKENDSKQKLQSVFKISLFVIFSIFSVYILLNVHQPTSSLVLRNVQGLIYPGLKVLRLLSVPIIKQFPRLSYLYDESCLVENPYFYVSEMECWPCQNVHSVIDLSGFTNHSLYQTGTPYIFRTNQRKITFKTIKNLYQLNIKLFITESDNIRSSNTSINSLEDAFKDEPTQLTHIQWRINKMQPGRLIRQIFPRPFIISEWSGQSIERFVIIDGAKASSYNLPNTECSYSFLIQGSGERTIILRPSKECGETCRTVSIVLKQSFVLWYNWWYWRPISLPAENSSESITYLTSLC